MIGAKRGLVALVLVACGSFGADPPAAQPADAGASSSSSSSSGGADASVDASRDAGELGPSFTCDRFAVNEPLGDQTFWNQLSPKPPVVDNGHALFSADSSGASYLTTQRRKRTDTIRFSATFTVKYPTGWNPDNFKGWSRIFDIDASINVSGGEVTGIEINGTQFRVIYRDFVLGNGGVNQTEIAGPSLLLDHAYTLELEERFSKDEGYIRVTFDDNPALTIFEEHLANEQTNLGEWQLRVGPSNIETTPIVDLDVSEVCVSP